MVIRVQTRNPIGPQIWSWGVVGTAFGVFIAAAIGCMTSGHPLIADACYAVGMVLLVAKFITWEDVRQQEPKRRRRANSLALAISIVVLAFVIAGNHHLNPSSANIVPNPTLQSTATQGQSSSEPASKPLVSSETNKTKDDGQVKAQHHAPKDELTAKVDGGKKATDSKNPTPPITINNAPNGIATSGGSVAIAPNGIANAAPNFGNQTVNNAPPARRLSGDRTTLIACLKSKPGKFSIAALANNQEAYDYAQDWRDLLLASGWEIEHKDIPIQIFMIGGGMWSGVRINMHAVVKDGTQIADDSSEKTFYSCLQSSPMGITAAVIPYIEIPTGVVRIFVSSHP
jgi:hypothetical protein